MANFPKPIEKRTTFGNLSRSVLMSRVKSRDNLTTELKLIELFKEHHLKGWRRHLNLPGKPDFSWPKLKIAIFVDGCFWHGHDCGKKLVPKTNTEAWTNKIDKTKKHDRDIATSLATKGWNVIRIWECELKKTPNKCISLIKKGIEDSYDRPIEVSDTVLERS